MEAVRPMEDYGAPIESTRFSVLQTLGTDTPSQAQTPSHGEIQASRSERALTLDRQAHTFLGTGPPHTN